MKRITHQLYDYLLSIGLTENTAKYLNMFALLLLLLLLLYVIDFVTRKLLRAIFSRLANRSKTNFDDILITNKAPRNIAHIIPLLIALEFVPIVFSDFLYAEDIIEKILQG